MKQGSFLDEADAVLECWAWGCENPAVTSIREVISLRNLIRN